MSLTQRLTALARPDENETQVGTQDPVTRAMVTVPWVGRTQSGVWIGEDRSVWLYRKLPPYSYTWETASARLTTGDALYQLFVELGRTSKPPAVGEFASLAKLRHVHLFSHIRYVRPTLPAGASADERAFLEEVFEEDQTAVPEQLTVIGVKLWPTSPLARRRRNRSVLGQIRQIVGELTNTALPDLANYQTDMTEVATILARADAQIISDAEAHTMERWLSDGKTRTPFYIEEPDRLVVRERNARAFDRWLQLSKLATDADREGDHERAEELLSAAEGHILAGGNAIQLLSISEQGIGRAEIGTAPDAGWIADAQQHENAAITVSLRFQLEPASVTRNRARKQQKQAFKQADEEEAANAKFASSAGLERVEIGETLSGAQSVEDHYATTSEPSIVKLSGVFARVVRDPSEETFDDFWRSRYELDAVPLVQRQAEAWLETLPCSPLLAEPKRPFSHDAVISLIAHSAIGSSARLGDDPTSASNIERIGVLAGTAHPGGTPLWLNPFASGEQNTPTTMVVIGDPGSGKTFCVQLLCYQFALQGLPVFFINPKGDTPSSSLRSYAEFCGGECIVISQVPPGAFDPFRYAKGRTIVEIALEHITTALNERGDALSRNQTIALSQALWAGVEADAGCVGKCLEFLPPEHQELANQIRDWSLANSNFALGVSLEKRGPLGASRRFTLVEFDQGAALPEGTNPNELTMMENSSIAGQRLLWRAGIEIIREHDGGIVAGDEAWTFLSSPQAASVINSLNRKGRSLGIFLVLMTQKIADVATADMEGYLSRVGVMKLDDEREIEAALDLCRMEKTDELVRLIRSAKPSPPDPGDPARGIPPTPAKPSRMVFRDLDGRHGIVTVEPIPERYRMAFSTNRGDVVARQASRAVDGLPLESARNYAGA